MDLHMTAKNPVVRSLLEERNAILLHSLTSIVRLSNTNNVSVASLEVLLSP